MEEYLAVGVCRQCVKGPKLAGRRIANWQWVAGVAGEERNELWAREMSCGLAEAGQETRW